MINEIRSSVKELHPLIHCITNPISINQCANAILAVGARPIMAEHPKEVAEITATARSLMLNLGNITDTRMESMQLSAQAAMAKNIPLLLDVVGIACSGLRRSYACALLENINPAVIKGNYSEINALYNTAYHSSGVDADGSLDKSAVSKAASELARKYHTIILASGKTDIVTDGKQIVYIKNGTRQLATVTGTGCMLGALCACYLSVNQDISAVVTACAVLGICGQLSETAKGSGSFMVNLLNHLSTLTDEEVANYLDLEELNVENI
ncbi:MAG: hydroxyethylthiazole kinase [Lachnospiraceae bacterium]|nr:hydroxyethylthiazole kinase [Lachnospiraceae bacterium]